MEIGIALPNSVRGTDGERIVEWARRAEERGFSCLGTIDRLVYDSYEPLTALAAAAAATERIRLATTVLLAPLRPNALALAKQALSVNALSGGRFLLGVGLGAREDDYHWSGIETRGRGRRLDETLDVFKQAWSDDRIGPRAAGRPKLILGGHADVSFARAARHGDGWIAAGSGPDQFREGAEKARAAWREAGREDAPHTMALAYFSLGGRAQENAENSLGDYYSWLGEEVAGMIVSAAAKDAESVRRYTASYAELGCDELVFCPSSSEVEQVDLLAEAASI